MRNVILYFILFLAIIFPQNKEASVQKKNIQTSGNNLSIWFNHPAEEWNEALPVGNGSLGAMIFGGIKNERLQLNEESVWRGKQEDFVNPAAKKSLPIIRELLFDGKYKEAEKLTEDSLIGEKKVWSTYQTLGDLLLNFKYPEGEIKNYKRELDIENAVAGVSFNIGEIKFTREIFSSFPARVIVISLTANKSAQINFKAELSRPGNKAKITVDNNFIKMSENIGDGEGVTFAANLKIINFGGRIFKKEIIFLLKMQTA